LVREDFDYLDECPYGVTLYDSETGMNIDLNEELTVAGFKYIDRNLILDNSIAHEVSGTEIRVPKPSVDLLVIIDHSVFKEWIYTLRDFYTTMLWLKILPKTLSLAYRKSDSVAAHIFLSITYLISKEAIGEDHSLTRKLQENLQDITEVDVPNLPYKYKYIDLAKAYVYKATYFSKRVRPEDLLRYLLTRRSSRLFRGFITRESY
jgi:hypothetical protein